jgi:3D (Asp-Asp-Asp) domain-containing protein
MQVTAYCPCKRCCGPTAQGLTASGRPISFNAGRFVAADTHVLRFNTRLVIPGYADEAPVQVIDRGGAIKGNHIDLFFPTHDQARQWGMKWMAVTVLD